MNEKTYQLKELAEITQSILEGNPEKEIRGAASIEDASENDITFIATSQYVETLNQSKAGAYFISPGALKPSNANFLITKNPTLAFEKVVELFDKKNLSEITGFNGVHSTAVIHPTAVLGKGTTIGPYAVIDKDVRIGDNTTIFASCYIGLGSVIGNDCILYPHVVLREGCIIGNDVILQAGSIIGSCGFGYTQDQQWHHVKLHHFGNVEIGDHVEIGANSTVDRARFKTTLIKEGTKIDNLVQIAHNVVIGKHCIIVGQTGIAGSSHVGDHVIIGGQVAVKDHVSIASKSRIAARSGISKDLKEGTYSGSPALPIHEYNRNSVLLRNIQKVIDKISDLSERVKALEKLK